MSQRLAYDPSRHTTAFQNGSVCVTGYIGGQGYIQTRKRCDLFQAFTDAHRDFGPDIEKPVLFYVSLLKQGNISQGDALHEVAEHENVLNQLNL